MTLQELLRGLEMYLYQLKAGKGSVELKTQVNERYVTIVLLNHLYVHGTPNSLGAGTPCV